LRSLEAAQGLRRWLPVALVVLPAFFALLFHLRLPGRLPSGEDHRAAASALVRQAQAGDGVLLFPWWTERARLYLPSKLAPVGYLGSESDAMEDHPRIWVLSQPSLPRADLGAFEKAFLPDRTPVGEAQTFGPLSLRAYVNGRYRPATFSTRSVNPRAWNVYVESPSGERTPCAWNGQRHNCASGAFATGPQWHEVFYRPLRCLYLHPPGGPARLVLELPDVTLGDSLALEAGVLWEYAPRKGYGQTAAHLGVEAPDGTPLLRIALEPGTEGLRTEQRPTAGINGTGILKLWLQSDSAQDRELCVNVVSRREPS